MNFARNPMNGWQRPNLIATAVPLVLDFQVQEKVSNTFLGTTLNKVKIFLWAKVSIFVKTFKFLCTYICISRMAGIQDSFYFYLVRYFEHARFLKSRGSHFSRIVDLDFIVIVVVFSFFYEVCRSLLVRLRFNGCLRTYIHWKHTYLFCLTIQKKKKKMLWIFPFRSDYKL